MPGRFVDTTKEHVAIRYRRQPHWRADGAIYFVTFRLADSLPRVVLDALEAMPKDSLERIRLAERELDKSSGSCILRSPPIANIVIEAMKSFDPERYSLYSCCVMPNHVHAVLSPNESFSLEKILHSWKSFTAKEINRHLGLSGRRWEPEYFDHIVRNGTSFERFIRYVVDNPRKARLGDWPWVYIAGPESDM